jgi:sugar lactone lactonase YvrE
MGANQSRARIRWLAAGVFALATLLAGPIAAEDQPPFDSKSQPITNKKAFGFNTDGPAVDAEGNLYVVNFVRNGTIGKLAKGASQFAPFAVLDEHPHEGSVGNGIRFDRDGRMFIADFKHQNVFVIEPGDNKPKVYFTAGFTQPNDLAVARDGTLYASDPHFSVKTGRIWRITRGADGKAHGGVMVSDRALGSTNGLDLSPDGTTLYVTESNSHELWAYRLDGNRLRDPRKVFHFPDQEVDGVRTDVDGRIYVARPSKHEIAIIKPAASGSGTLVRTVQTQGNDPTNLTFGGPDGRTVFVTQMDGQLVESFRTDRPGREPCLQTQAPGMC